MTKEYMIPSNVVSYHDDMFNPICEYLEGVGAIENSGRVTELTIDVKAEEPLVVTNVEERDK